jgi:phage-related protein
MNTFNEVFYNLEVTDEELLLRLLNTILDNEYEDKFYSFLLMTELVLSRKNVRTNLHSFKLKISKYDTMNFSDFIEKIKEVQDKNLKDDIHALYEMCFLRSIFEHKFKDKIKYRIPQPDIELKNDEDHWYVFTKYIDYSILYNI